MKHPNATSILQLVDGVHAPSPCAQAGPHGGDVDYRLFSASEDNTVRLWDPYDMACIRVMEEGHSEVSAMTFYEGWNLLITGGWKQVLPS